MKLQRRRPTSIALRQSDFARSIVIIIFFISTFMEAKISGVIEKLTDRGFGFIKVEGHDKAIFFHAQQVRGGTIFNDLQEGDQVLINEIVKAERGLAAEGVYLVQ